MKARKFSTWKAVRDLTSGGWSERAIADRLGISERHVRRLRARTSDAAAEVRDQSRELHARLESVS